MYRSDIILDFAWFASKKGKLGKPRIAIQRAATATDPQTEFCLYGESAADSIRHLRVVTYIDGEKDAHAYHDSNMVHWVRSLEVASSITSAHFATAQLLGPNTTTFMSVFGKGGWDSDTVDLTPEFLPPATTDFEGAAKLIALWRPEFRGHLPFCSRFLNTSLSADVRWLNGYRCWSGIFFAGERDS